ncbi:hypothetical protein R16034_01219 [Ralstonia edaphis]|uniref:Uncharacterized protein n=1 Tax=Ralstonia edaphi TaxID=3058599 RepID=A0AB72WZF5_9RALS|nr:hypothetical protein R16034_01219 [Ralstonia sp. LMG 6871]
MIFRTAQGQNRLREAAAASGLLVQEERKRISFRGSRTQRGATMHFADIAAQHRRMKGSGKRLSGRYRAPRRRVRRSGRAARPRTSRRDAGWPCRWLPGGCGAVGHVDHRRGTGRCSPAIGERQHGGIPPRGGPALDRSARGSTGAGTATGTGSRTTTVRVGCGGATTQPATEAASTAHRVRRGRIDMIGLVLSLWKRAVARELALILRTASRKAVTIGNSRLLPRQLRRLDRRRRLIGRRQVGGNSGRRRLVGWRNGMCGQHAIDGHGFPQGKTH